MTPTASRIGALFEETVTCYYISIKGYYFSPVKVTASLKVEMHPVHEAHILHIHIR